MMPRKDSSANFSLHPLFGLAASFACGIAAVKYAPVDWKIALAFALVGAVLTAVFRRRRASALLLLFAFFAAGAFCLQVKVQSVPPNRLKKIYDEQRIKSGEPVKIEGVVESFEETVGGFFIELKTDQLIYQNEPLAVSGKARLFAPVPHERLRDELAALNLEYGSRVRATCSLRREENYQNPGGVSRREILDQQEIDAICTIKNPQTIEKISERAGFFSFRWLFEIRRKIIDGFRARFSVSTAGVMIASLLGSKYFLDKPTAELFREGGTFHVLVISGLHITFIGGLTLLLVRFLTRRRLWQFLIASSLLWAFSFAVGAEVPVVRASLMFTVLLFSEVVYRKGNLLNSLGLCALGLLVWRPEDLFSQSFQLTFASVLAIVAFAFPLVENLRAVGEWRPSAETPFPPNVSAPLRKFCESLYWREAVWQAESRRQIWSARVFKTTSLKILEAKSLQKSAQYLFEGVLVSLVVQIWLLPLSVFYFHRVSVASVLLNLWVGFFIALESFAAIFALIFAQVSDDLAFPLIKLTEFFNYLLLWLPSIFVENDAASFRVAGYAGNLKLVYFLFYAPLLVLTVLLLRWRPFDLISNFKSRISDSETGHSRALKFIASPSRLLKLSLVAVAALTAVIVFHPLSAPAPDGRLRIDFLDVGQGDAALVTFPNGETLLVDGGGRPNFNNLYVEREAAEREVFEPDRLGIGEAVVSQFLWEKGYSEIDYILATHADADHMQGLTDVAKNFRVRAAFFGRTPARDEDFTDLEKVLRRRGVEIRQLKRGDLLSFESASVEVLYPESDDSPAASDNNHSIVLRLIFGARRFLLTGDIERETEKFLVQNPSALQADVVKVAHHGSKTSSTQSFIDAAKAVYAVISVGKTSPFGHPHREVVERWEAAGARILRTGERGTITISTDGKDLIVERFAP